MSGLAPRKAVRALKARGSRRGSQARSDTPGTSLGPPEGRGGTLTAAQIRYFETFGFLAIRGLFADDVERLVTGFEDVFADHAHMETHDELHFDETRQIVPGFVQKSPLLEGLPTDSRVLGIVTSLLGDQFEDAESDGNIFSCDTSWHPDTYSAPMTEYHIKLSFYLDPLGGSSGAIRLLPGTNHYTDSYPRALRRDFADAGRIQELFGVQPCEIPSYVIESTPGDVIVWNFRTIHASFGGGQRRRLFSLNFRQLSGSAIDGSTRS